MSKIDESFSVHEDNKIDINNFIHINTDIS